jgi:hypothetical protein
MTERIKLGLFKNEDRQADTHPQLRNGKPQEINGQRYWVTAFINSDDPDTQAAIERMVDKLQTQNGNYPIISVSLTPAAAQAPQQQSSKGWDDDDDPF